MVKLVVAPRTRIPTMAADPALTLGGVPVVDPTRRCHIGGGQGGIHGAAYLGVAPDIERGPLVVSGAACRLMRRRSVNWNSHATR